MIHAQIVPDLDSDQRREPRLVLSADFALRELGTMPVEARLLNISSHGFMAESEAAFSAGSRVWLTLPGIGRVNALVLWTKGAGLGGEFQDPIDPLEVFHAAGNNA